MDEQRASMSVLSDERRARWERTRLQWTSRVPGSNQGPVPPPALPVPLMSLSSLPLSPKDSSSLFSAPLVEFSPLPELPGTPTDYCPQLTPGSLASGHKLRKPTFDD